MLAYITKSVTSAACRHQPYHDLLLSRWTAGARSCGSCTPTGLDIDRGGGSCSTSALVGCCARIDCYSSAAPAQTSTVQKQETEARKCLWHHNLRVHDITAVFLHLRHDGSRRLAALSMSATIVSHARRSSCTWRGDAVPVGRQGEHTARLAAREAAQGGCQAQQFLHRSHGRLP